MRIEIWNVIEARKIVHFWTMVLLLILDGQLIGQHPDVQLELPEGFKAELLYKVPNRQGSWVSMTHDPQGRLIVSDQYGGLFRIDTGGNEIQVEPLQMEIGFAQGLLYAFNSLYVVAHEGTFDSVTEDGTKTKFTKSAGLYRLNDRGNDGKFESPKLLRKFEGGGEHGPHAIVLGPDKKSLYICAGNHTKIPNPESSRVPRVWQEDQLTSRLPDAGGHGVGIMAPGGWVCKTDPNGEKFELVSVGFRNQYDIAFNRDGELFSYDADMEWDIGLPWYRPTRVCHVTSGSEFGWRNGSGKWPSYFPDSLPSVIDIGPGSPTGITFGTASKFPPKFQGSLFISDWSYGIIYRVQLKNDGSSYSADKETFCTAPVLPITDLIVNSVDGAMYFLVGGRRCQSALYRISYVGNEPTDPNEPKKSQDSKIALRRELENLHVDPSESNIQLAWPSLSHEDRFIRFAARTAIELAPGKDWYQRAFNETNPQAKLESLLAVVRTSTDENYQAETVAALNSMDFESLEQDQKLHLLRTYGLVLMRMGEPASKTLQSIHAMTRHYPSDSDSVNRELARLLAAAESDDVVTKTVDLLLASDMQQQQIHYAMVIHTVKNGWTRDLQQKYLAWFADSARYAGGSSFRNYLTNIRAKFAGELSVDDQEYFAQLINQPIDPVDPYAELKMRPVVKRWSMLDLKNISTDDCDVENGRKMFAIAQCYKCHIVAGEGGIVGPDLTTAGHRLNNQDLLETIIDPNKAISDQYRATTFQLEDGRIVSGRIANLVRNEYLVQEDMINPGELTRIKAEDIEEMRASKNSMMPSGLLDTLTQNEIVDLVAYLRSVLPDK